MVLFLGYDHFSKGEIFVAWLFFRWRVINSLRRLFLILNLHFFHRLFELVWCKGRSASNCTWFCTGHNNRIQHFKIRNVFRFELSCFSFPLLLHLQSLLQLLLRLSVSLLRSKLEFLRHRKRRNLLRLKRDHFGEFRHFSCLEMRNGLIRRWCWLTFSFFAWKVKL